MPRRLFTILSAVSLIERGSAVVEQAKRLLERMTLCRWLLVCGVLLTLSVEACYWSYRFGEMSGRRSVLKHQPEEMASTPPVGVIPPATSLPSIPTTRAAEPDVEDLISDVEEGERLRTQLQDLGAASDYIEARMQVLIAEQAKRRER